MNYVDYEEKMLQSFEYETTINSDGNILGICELGKATIELLNENNNYSSFKDSWIKTPQGSFYIYNVEPVQERVNIKLECYDIKYKLDTLYDSSKHTFPCTLKEWRNSIFDECDVTYDNADFPNSSLTIEKEPPLDSGISNRNVIALIAQAGASFVVTDSSDKFYFKWFDNTIYEATDWTELTTEKEATKPINYIVLGRGDAEDNYCYPLVKPTNAVEFRIDNNYILDPQDTTSNIDLRESTIIPLYGQINGLSFIPYTMRTQFISNKLSINLGNKIKYKDIWGNELTSCIMTKKIKWLSGDFKKSDNYEITLSASEIKESSTKVSYNKDLKQEIIEISRKTDKNAGKIEDMISTVDGQNEKISKITQTTDEINSKISDIADITTSGESQQASVNLVKVNESEPIAIKIHPISEDISYLYPSDYLYPADDLYLMNRIIRFTNTDTNEVVDYELPADLLYYDANNYDEFILNYDSQTCSVIKRVEYDKATNKNKLKTTEETISCDEYPTIALTAGNYTVSLPGYSNAYIYVQLMASNIYTTQFATKVEMNSEISQTKSDINLKVNELTKADNKMQGEIDVQSKQIVLKVDNNGKIVKATLTADPKDGTTFTIDADNINLTATDIINLLANNTINLTSGNIVIDSTNFKVDKDGNTTMGNANITGGNINMLSPNNNPKHTLTGTAYNGKKSKLEMCCDGFTIYDENGNLIGYLHTGTLNGNSSSSLFFSTNNNETSVDPGGIEIVTKSGTSVSSGTYISSKLIETPKLTQTSTASKKKNFEKYSGAIDELDRIDIYKYNLKYEKDDTKKHLGFVIGKKYKYSETITNDKNDGVDLYSMTSLCLQAIKEQQTIINELKEEIKILKERNDEK